MMRVLICDDHAIVREGLKQILAREPEMEVAGEASTGAEVLEAVRRGGWDVLVLDIALPDRNGLDVLKQLKVAQPSLPVLVLSMYEERQFALRVLKAGANGYLEKASLSTRLVEALKQVAAGERYLSADLARRLAVQQISGTEGPLHDALSDREFQVMGLIAQGTGVKDIASQLCISVKTVSNYRVRLLKKLGLQNDAQLTRYALEHHLIP